MSEAVWCAAGFMFGVMWAVAILVGLLRVQLPVEEDEAANDPTDAAQADSLTSPRVGQGDP